jgi:hypothetical protein
MIRSLATAVLLLLVAGCGPARQAMDRLVPGTAPAPPPAGPAEVPPGPAGDEAAWHAALNSNSERIVISREARRLWLMRGDSAVFTAPVAVGRDTIFRYGEREWDFNTPTGRMTVLAKETSPLWVPPDWHYLEKAVERGLEPVQLRNSQRVELTDSTVIEVRNDEVGRTNRYGNWRPFTPGHEIIFDDQIFIPPIGSPQRRIPEVLGTHRLILGDGYLIHGTPEEDSIGDWASHGCVRMFNVDVAELYDRVPVRTPVYIY